MPEFRAAFDGAIAEVGQGGPGRSSGRERFPKPDYEGAWERFWGKHDSGAFGVVGWVVGALQARTDITLYDLANGGHTALVPGPDAPVQRLLSFRVYDTRYDRADMWDFTAVCEETEQGDGPVRARLFVPAAAGGVGYVDRDLADAIPDPDFFTEEHFTVPPDRDVIIRTGASCEKLGQLTLEGIELLTEGLDTDNFYPMSHFMDQLPAQAQELV
jgi:hypothetical protein